MADNKPDQPADAEILTAGLQGRTIETAIVPALAERMARAIRLRMVVAFWSIDPQVLSPRLKDLLALDGSFACVDLHLPTHVDRMCDMAAHGSHVYLRLDRLAREESPDGPGLRLPQELLHAKTLLFDFDDGTAELWVGSHNWTERALGGINVELSAVLGLRQGSTLYERAESDLEAARQRCVQCRPDLRDLYRRLQGELPTKPVIALRASAAGTLVGKQIHIFGARLEDRGELNRVAGEFLVAVLDVDTNEEHVFDGRLVASAELPAARTGAPWVEPSSAAWALHERAIPLLQPAPARYEDEVGDRAAFLASLLLSKSDGDDFVLSEPPPRVEYLHSPRPATVAWAREAGWCHPGRRIAPRYDRPDLEEAEHCVGVDRRTQIYAAEEEPLVRRLVVRRVAEAQRRQQDLFDEDDERLP